MLTSLALIFLVGLAAAALCQLLHIPRILGMLAVGVALGPHALNLLDASILSISGDLRQMALVIILLKAGLSLNPDDLKKVGRPAVLMAFVPASCEILAFILFAPALLGVSRAEAAVMGAVIGAVSPAVVVPRMVQLMESGWGTKKSVPQLILAGASCDDVYVIVLFTAFVSMAQGGEVSAASLLEIPVSVVLGVLLGAAAGWAIGWFFETAFAKRRYVRNSTKTVVVLGLAFSCLAIETALKGTVPVSGLLAVVSMACVLKRKSVSFVSRRLSEKFGKLWIAAELLLFVLVGAAVDIRYTVSAGAAAIFMLVISLMLRSLGVAVCTLRTPLSAKERLFCCIAYLPKATVQAAIGSVPLSLGLPCGQIVLSVAVLAILISAPLGAFGMDLTYQRLLTKESGEKSA